MGTLGSYVRLSADCTSGRHGIAPLEKYRLALLCQKLNINDTESTGSYVRGSHQTSVHSLHLLSTWLLPNTFLDASPVISFNLFN